MHLYLLKDCSAYVHTNSVKYTCLALLARIWACAVNIIHHYWMSMFPTEHDVWPIYVSIFHACVTSFRSCRVYCTDVQRMKVFLLLLLVLPHQNILLKRLAELSASFVESVFYLRLTNYQYKCHNTLAFLNCVFVNRHHERKADGSDFTSLTVSVFIRILVNELFTR